MGRNCVRACAAAPRRAPHPAPWAQPTCKRRPPRPPQRGVAQRRCDGQRGGDAGGLSVRLPAHGAARVLPQVGGVWSGAAGQHGGWVPYSPCRSIYTPHHTTYTGWRRRCWRRRWRTTWLRYWSTCGASASRTWRVFGATTRGCASSLAPTPSPTRWRLSASPWPTCASSWRQTAWKGLCCRTPRCSPRRPASRLHCSPRWSTRVRPPTEI